MASQSVQDCSSKSKEPKITVASFAIVCLLFAELSKNLSILTVRIPVGLVCFDFFFLAFTLSPLLLATIGVYTHSWVVSGVSDLSKTFLGLKEDNDQENLKILIIMISANTLQKLIEQGFGLVYNGREHV